MIFAGDKQVQIALTGGTWQHDNRAMIACARRTLVLADHSKLGTAAPFHVAAWPQVHALQIDEPWDEGAAQGVPVVVADDAWARRVTTS